MTCIDFLSDIRKKDFKNIMKT